MSYHWSDMCLLWAALEQDWDTIDKLIYLYKPEALMDLADACELLKNKARNLYAQKALEKAKERG